jgi:hypothetical protein
MNADKEFHAHLDSCEQCEKNPWDLCPLGKVLLMATGAGPSEPMPSEVTEDDIRIRINRQISQLRAKDQHKHDCNCGECMTDWQDDSHWPILFWELPRNTHLFRQEKLDDGLPESYKVCGCFAQGNVRVCQDGDSAGAAVVRAWVAFTLGMKIFGSIPDFQPFPSPGSNSVH